ncbi:MAG TPA: DUF1203 domain-containing protein [Gemmatimonadaceae bacterium]
MTSVIESVSPARAARPLAPSSGSVTTTFRCLAIPSAVAEAVRATMRAPGYGHPAHVEVATGHGPCRHCLRTFDIGRERRILFTYDAFDGVEPLPLPGPVFIHADACSRYPEDGGFPEDLRAHPVTLNAYARGRRVLAQEYVTDGVVEPVLERLFARQDTAYVHVRDTEAGCYDLRIERAPGTAD